MAYADTRNTASPTSLAAVIGMHALAGVVLIGALSVTGDWVEPDVPTPTFDVRDTIPPPPTPPETIPEPSVDTPVTPPLFVPEPKLDLIPIEPRVPTTDILPSTTPVIPRPGVTPGLIVPPSVPSVAPVGASPRNDPGRWVTDSDYRSSWIRRDMVGTARFRLDIAANGRVTDCTITQSTGHEPLDTATCRLIQRRARFQPARGTEGEAVPGSFESSIVWRLPE